MRSSHTEMSDEENDDYDSARSGESLTSLEAQSQGIGEQQQWGTDSHVINRTALLTRRFALEEMRQANAQDITTMLETQQDFQRQMETRARARAVADQQAITNAIDAKISALVETLRTHTSTHAQEHRRTRTQEFRQPSIDEVKSQYIDVLRQHELTADYFAAAEQQLADLRLFAICLIACVILAIFTMACMTAAR